MCLYFECVYSINLFLDRITYLQSATSSHSQNSSPVNAIARPGCAQVRASIETVKARLIKFYRQKISALSSVFTLVYPLFWFIIEVDQNIQNSRRNRCREHPQKMGVEPDPIIEEETWDSRSIPGKCSDLRRSGANQQFWQVSVSSGPQALSALILIRDCPPRCPQHLGQHHWTGHAPGLSGEW